MKKLSICANHSFPHVGGVETIIKLLAENMNNKYDVFVDVFSRSLQKHINHNGVNYIPIKTYSELYKYFISNKYNHNFIYSDHFKFLPDILNNYDQIPGTKSIALVGMYRSYSNGKILQHFFNRKDELKLIVHSKYYQDYELCESLGFPVNVIHNGVDFSEFYNNKMDFREKYNVKEKNIILCVSNFFPGKGQEYLVDVMNIVKNKLEDYIIVFISSTVNFKYAQLLSKKTEQKLKNNGINHLFLVDVPREDTISAYNAAGLFVTASCKEVAPVCVLEAMASKTPWVAFPVGNIPSLSGGIVVPCENKNIEGYLVPNDTVINKYANAIIELYNNNIFYDKCVKEGHSEVEINYNWDNITDQYYKLFFEHES